MTRTFAAFMLVLGMSIGSSLVIGFGIGRWWGEWELRYLMDIPQGGVVLSPRTGAYWIKLNNNAMRFVRLPDPREARTVRLFPQKEEPKDEKD